MKKIIGVGTLLIGSIAVANAVGWSITLICVALTIVMAVSIWRKVVGNKNEK